MLTSFDPSLQTFHDLFESTVKARGNKHALGWRQWNPVAKKWDESYTWISYAEVAQRRKNIGAGISELHHRLGIKDDKYGVGLWSQNRAEWHLVGKHERLALDISTSNAI